MKKTSAQKSQTQLWNNFYRASLFARSSIGWSHPADQEVKQRFAELQRYLEQLIAQSESEAAESDTVVKQI